MHPRFLEFSCKNEGSKGTLKTCSALEGRKSRCWRGTWSCLQMLKGSIYAVLRNPEMELVPARWSRKMHIFDPRKDGLSYSEMLRGVMAFAFIHHKFSDGSHVLPVWFSERSTPPWRLYVPTRCLLNEWVNDNLTSAWQQALPSSLLELSLLGRGLCLLQNPSAPSQGCPVRILWTSIVAALILRTEHLLGFAWISVPRESGV